MRSNNKSFSSFRDYLESDLRKHISGIRRMENGGDLYSMVISLTEKSILEVVLMETGGNQTKASKILGMNRNTLKRKITDHQIEVSSFAKP